MSVLGMEAFLLLYAISTLIRLFCASMGCSEKKEVCFWGKLELGFTNIDLVRTVTTAVLVETDTDHTVFCSLDGPKVYLRGVQH